MGYIECSSCDNVLDCEFVGTDDCINYINKSEEEGEE